MKSDQVQKTPTMKTNLASNTLTMAVLPLLLALLATSCGDKAAESQASSPQSSSKQTPQKREVDFFRTERRAAKTYYVKGEQKPYTGKINGRFPDGKSMVEFFCQDGFVNGEVIDWHTNGQMKSKCSYKLGVKEGVAEAWADNGVLKIARNYQNGMAEGLQTDYWDNGKKKIEAEYKFGNLDGERAQWNEDGSLFQRYHVADSEARARVSEATNNPFAPIGNAIVSDANASDLKFSDLERRGSAHFYVKGEQTPFTGKIVSRFTNGNKQDEAICVNGLIEGIGINWYESGQMKSRYNYVHGRSDGKAEEWNEKGMLKVEKHLKHSKPHGLATTWSSNGKMDFQSEFVDGKENGRKIEWTENGEFQKTEEVNPPSTL